MAVFLATEDLPIRSASHFRLTAAGSESNVMAGLAMLGHRSRFATRVGNDGLGMAVIRRLRAIGVEVHAIVDDEKPTGVLVRDHPQLAPVEVCYARSGSAASRFTWEDILPVLDPEPELMFLSGITPVLSAQAAAACQAALTYAKQRAIRVVFDPNLRGKLMPVREAARLLRPFLEQADIVIAGAEELTALTGARCHRSGAQQLLAGGAQTVVVKLGPRGAYGADSTDECELGSMAASAVDPVGAGDAFAAGFLSGLLRERSLGDAMLEATAVAACVVATRGDMEGLPSAIERDALVAGRQGGSDGVNR